MKTFILDKYRSNFEPNMKCDLCIDHNFKFAKC